jgi:putative nucleotidyltransferase with HDIG domain
VVSIIIIVTVLPKELQFKYEYNLNMPWMYEDLVAPEDFPIIKTESEIKKEKEQLRKQVKPYFVYNEDLTKQTLAEAEISFDSAWVQQFGFEDKKQYELNRNFYLNTLKEILHQGVINIPNAFRLKDDQVITLIRNNTGHEGFVKDYYTVSSAFEEIKKRTNRDENLQASFLKPLFLRAIVQNINYDKNKTENELSTILDNLSPYRGMVQKGQRIIDKGEIISPDVYRILQSLQKDFESKTRQSSITVTIGESILIAIPMIAFFLYLFFFRNDIYEDSKNLLMLLILIITMVVLTRILVTYHSSYVFIVPLMISPIVIRAFYDTQLALITHIITVILVSFIVPSSFQFLFLQLMTGLITIISIRTLQKRSQFLITSIIIFVSFSVIYFGMILAMEGGVEEINGYIISYFAISAALTFFSFPLIFLFEKLFMLVTDMSLLEYSDTNNTLIRKLAEKAPGTFHHSIQVANLAEEATLLIGGNALLVRAGAMYHDIGKAENPMFFTENQNGSFNPHDELTFQESSQIIINHVLKGIEIAKNNNIPDQIIDFIRTHHGTKRVEYFYRMYKKDFPEDDVRLADFTYHGPIPYSKETCVLMMADAAEAASRSLKTPDAKSISELIDTIIKSQMDQGQFNNANITMKEINMVKKVFKRKLMNIYHVRIEYPSE